jgi:hypothetical protein
MLSLAPTGQLEDERKADLHLPYAS